MANINPAPVNTAVDDLTRPNLQAALDPTQTGRILPNKIWVGWFQQIVKVLNNLVSSMIKGTTTNDNAAAGYIGEYITPTDLTGVSLTTGTVINVSSAVLAAGDYEITGTVRFNPSAASTINQIVAGVSLTSNNVGAVGTFTQLVAPFSTGQTQTIAAPLQRISLATTTTVYLTAAMGFAVSTAAANGYLHIRRVR